MKYFMSTRGYCGSLVIIEIVWKQSYSKIRSPGF